MAIRKRPPGFPGGLRDSGGYFFFDNAGAGIGNVYWDQNGSTNGSSDAVQIAVLQNTTANQVSVLTANDFHIVA